MKDRRFNAVRIVASKTGRMLVVTSVLRAVEQLLNYWPVEQGEKLSVARRALLLCLERKLSPADARGAFIVNMCDDLLGAFIEAAKEAGNYVDEPMRLAPAGNVKKWHKSKRGRFVRLLARQRRRCLLSESWIAHTRQGTICVSEAVPSRNSLI